MEGFFAGFAFNFLTGENTERAPQLCAYGFAFNFLTGENTARAPQLCAYAFAFNKGAMGKTPHAYG